MHRSTDSTDRSTESSSKLAPRPPFVGDVAAGVSSSSADDQGRPAARALAEERSA
jgi:hypothetical protein